MGYFKRAQNLRTQLINNIFQHWLPNGQFCVYMKFLATKNALPIVKGSASNQKCNLWCSIVDSRQGSLRLLRQCREFWQLLL